MGLKQCGFGEVSKSGRALHIKLDLPNTIFTYHLYLQKDSLNEVLADRQDKVRVVVQTGNHEDGN